MSAIKVFKRKKNDKLFNNERMDFIIANDKCHLLISKTLDRLVESAGKTLLANGYNVKFEVSDKAYNVEKDCTYIPLNTSEKKRFNTYVKDLKRNY